MKPGAVQLTGSGEAWRRRIPRRHRTAGIALAIAVVFTRLHTAQIAPASVHFAGAEHPAPVPRRSIRVVPSLRAQAIRANQWAPPEPQDDAPRLNMRVWDGQRRFMGRVGRAIAFTVEITLTTTSGSGGEVRFGQGGCGNASQFEGLDPPWIRVAPTLVLTHVVRTPNVYTWRFAAQARDSDGVYSNIVCDYIVVEGREPASPTPPSPATPTANVTSVPSSGTLTAISQGPRLPAYLPVAARSAP